MGAGYKVEGWKVEGFLTDKSLQRLASRRVHQNNLPESFRKTIRSA